MNASLRQREAWAMRRLAGATALIQALEATWWGRLAVRLTLRRLERRKP